MGLSRIVSYFVIAFLLIFILSIAPFLGDVLSYLVLTGRIFVAISLIVIFLYYMPVNPDSVNKNMYLLCNNGHIHTGDDRFCTICGIKLHLN